MDFWKRDLLSLGVEPRLQRSRMKSDPLIHSYLLLLFIYYFILILPLFLIMVISACFENFCALPVKIASIILKLIILIFSWQWALIMEYLIFESRNLDIYWILSLKNRVFIFGFLHFFNQLYSNKIYASRALESGSETNSRRVLLGPFWKSSLNILWISSVFAYRLMILWPY